jgi:hypothetical protein
MKKIILFFVLIVFSNSTVIAQNVVYEGIIKDKNTKENLAYVNIGIVNKNTGTVSDVKGKFQLLLDNKNDAETMKLSMIGYKSLSFKVIDFKKIVTENPIIYLEKSVSELKEIVIKNKNLQTGILGNVLDKKTVSAGFVNNVLGNEIGIIVKLKSKPTFIEAFHAIVDYNKYKELKFRLNFYDLKKGLPNNTILQDNIIVTSTIKKGELIIDLNDYNIMVNEDFFVSIELIEGLGEGGLHFLADYSGSPIITRATSQGKWNKVEDLSFGFTLIAKY